jgi:hypothetical protein
MRTFGPFYPQRLQAAVSHAERLVELLAAEERQGHRGHLGRAWLAGRAGEVERFVEALVADWRAWRRTSDTAAAALREYLDALHDGMSAQLGMLAPACCLGASATTESAPHDPQYDAVVETLEGLDAPGERTR